MKSVISFVLVLAVLFAPSVRADEPSQSHPSNYEHLKDLEWLVGQWEADYVLPDGVPELGTAGDKAHSQVAFRWFQDKNYLVFTGTDTANGKVIITNRETTAWDAATGKLAHTIFGSTGFHGRGEWSGSGYEWDLSWSVRGPDNTVYTGTSKHKRIDENTYVWHMTGLTHNGEKISDWPAVTYKRVPQQSPLSQKARQQLRYFIGSWDYSWEQKGNTYKGTWNVRWSPDRTCLLSHWSNEGPNGRTKGTITIGWDEAKGRIIDATFASDGTYAIARYDIKSRRLNEGSRSGIGQDGKQMESKLRLEKKDNAFTWTVFDQKLDGEELPELVFAFRRTTND